MADDTIGGRPATITKEDGKVKIIFHLWQEIITVAWAQGLSSLRDKSIWYFLFFIFFLKKDNVFPVNLIEGFPDLSFKISIFFSTIPFLMPTSNALAKASLAAYLFA